MTGEQAASAVALFAEAERLACAGRTLFAKRVDETGAWAKSGHPSAAARTADEAGTTVGAALGTLATSWKLDKQPAVADALRSGELSGTAANDISDAAAANPGAEERDHLEIDHLIPFAPGGPTELDNLGRACKHHHELKTRQGWRLARAPDGSWTFDPPGPDTRAGSP